MLLIAMLFTTFKQREAYNDVINDGIIRALCLLYFPLIQTYYNYVIRDNGCSLFFQGKNNRTISSIACLHKNCEADSHEKREC